jgi:hypothetical protein
LLLKGRTLTVTKIFSSSLALELAPGVDDIGVRSPFDAGGVLGGLDAPIRCSLCCKTLESKGKKTGTGGLVTEFLDTGSAETQQWPRVILFIYAVVRM